MTSPSHSVKIHQSQKEREKKTIFGHVSDAMGLHLTKQVKGSVDFMTMIKNIVLSLATFLAIGFIVGMISDIFLKTGYLPQLGALMMLLFWVFRKGRGYLSERK